MQSRPDCDPAREQPLGQALGIGPGDPQARDICRRCGPPNLAARVPAQGLKEGVGRRGGAFEPFAEPLDVMQGHRRIRPSLAEAAAEHAPLVIEVLDQLPWPGKHGAGGSIEVFVE